MKMKLEFKKFDIENYRTKIKIKSIKSKKY